MLVYVLRRLAVGVLVIAGVTFVVFSLTQLAGDPATLMLPPAATRAEIEELRERLGLNDPVPVQYFRFAAGAARGDFGTSLQHGEPAMELLLRRMPATLQLGFAAVLLAVLVAVPLGLLAAVTRGSWIDFGSLLVALFGQSMPNFWLGILLINLFAVYLGWFPTSGRLEGWRSMVLPALTIAPYLMATLIRLVRSTVLDVLGQDYLRTARAKGVAEFRVLLYHGLRNALIPIVTVLGLQMGHVLGGAVVIESVFMWPGLGLFTIQAISNRDFPVIQAAVTLMATFIVVINLTVDLFYGYLDPRIRLE
jgi:ABC-type dipeptide/oligopeptide/nickel transport system permease component